MTALIPAMARELEIPCLFTIHNIHTMRAPLASIEDRGIDAAAFWRHLYFQRVPYSYDESREDNEIDFLTSAIFAAHYVNTVSPTFLREIIVGQHDFVEPSIQRELRMKYEADCAVGILNAPDPSFDPRTDSNLVQNYGPGDHIAAKAKNKRFLQDKLGLIVDETAPVFFWPSRLDNVQKGCQLLSDILYEMVSTYWDQRLQVVFVANGDYQSTFRDIARYHGLNNRVAICDFDEKLEHLAYGASDFMLMPSRFEPCGLPQMIAPIYGSLPVAHDTGGIHDTISHLDVTADHGNGFLFEVFDAPGLFWAVSEAMRFYSLEPAVRERQIARIMGEAAETFTHANTARQYIALYERMLHRPLITDYGI
jgi:starch synthase/alpha-amylase